MHDKCSLLIIKLCVSTTSHGLVCTTWGIVFSCSCVFWYSERLKSALLHFLYQPSCSHSIQIHMQRTSSSQFPYDCSSAGSISASVLRRYYYLFAFYGHTFYNGQLISNKPISLYVLCHIISFVGPTSIIYALSSCRCASLAIASCMSCMDIHTDRSIVVLIMYA